MLVWLKTSEGDYTVAERRDDTYYYLIGLENSHTLGDLKAFGFEVIKPVETPKAASSNQYQEATGQKPIEPNPETDNKLHSLQEWNDLGRWIKKGQKARDFRNNIALFHFEQTREAPAKEKDTGPLFGKRNTGRLKDDFDDDIPF